jgi:hypothetical protein
MGGAVVSVGVVVVGVVVVGDVVVFDDFVVVDDGVVAGPPPLLPVASAMRPKMIVAIRITTARPHSARTHGLRNQGEEFSSRLNSSLLFAPRVESLLE